MKTRSILILCVVAAVAVVWLSTLGRVQSPAVRGAEASLAVSTLQSGEMGSAAATALIPAKVAAEDAARVMEQLRRPVSVGVVRGASPDDPGIASAKVERSFRTLGPLSQRDVDHIRNKSDASLRANQVRLSELMATASLGEEPDVARFADLHWQVQWESAVLDALRRGDYASIAHGDREATNYFFSNQFAGCITSVVIGLDAVAVFVLCKDRYPDLFAAREQKQEARYYASEEFSKRFNALPEADRRELLAAISDPALPRHAEAMTMFSHKPPYVLDFIHEHGLVQARR